MGDGKEIGCFESDISLEQQRKMNFFESRTQRLGHQK